MKLFHYRRLPQDSVTARCMASQTERLSRDKYNSVRDGATPAVVQKQLRHSDPRTTLGIYTHVVGSHQRDAVQTRAARIVN